MQHCDRRWNVPSEDVDNWLLDVRDTIYEINTLVKVEVQSKKCKIFNRLILVKPKSVALSSRNQGTKERGKTSPNADDQKRHS